MKPASSAILHPTSLGKTSFIGIKILANIFILVFTLLLLAKSVYAIDYTISPQPESTDENQPYFTLTFTGLLDQNNYTLCPTNDQVGCFSGNTNSAIYPAQHPVNGQLQFIVCGDGSSRVKRCDPQNQVTTNSNADWFHGGGDYSVYLSDPSATNFIKVEFGIKFHYLIPTLTQDSNKNLTISLPSSDCRFPCANGDRNNFQLELKGNNHDFDDLRVGQGQTFGPLAGGDYILDLKYDGKPYVRVTFTIDSNGILNPASIKIINDPENHDFGKGGSGHNPCLNGVCDTAFGALKTDFANFTSQILKFAIGLAGGLALILMVVGSIRVLTSSGDQQRLNGGREMIVAAVAGLLFIIFSTLILQFLGLHILAGIL